MDSLLEQLKRKPAITGEELGLCIIRNDISIYSMQLHNVHESTAPLLDQEQLNSLLSKINSVEDADILECYVQLQSFVQRSQAMANAYNQQAQNGCCRLMMYMTQAQQVEHARKLIENLPIIMTETQFHEMKNPGKIARMRGVAVVANDFPCRPKCLDINDCFIEPEIDCFQEMMSLERTESMADKIRYFRDDLMKQGVRHQLAYNELYILISERIGLDEFTIFCIETDTIINQIKEMNSQRMDFENEIAGEGPEFDNKKRILSEVFEIIDIDSLYPEECNIEKVREKLKDIDVLRTSMDELISVLMGEQKING
ncbi:MAG: hypothetical protein Q4F95_08885 [Oscillospiraceae bacterium]|nr:hypothetical protein [Oscillospiraceae bacterium]